MENTKPLQKFGGNWTAKKLDIFTDYLNAYLTALQNQKFQKIYIDAFAGTGQIETRDGSQTLIGSAKRALLADQKFDQYIFVEKCPEKANQLKNMVDIEFTTLRNRVTVYTGDANEILEEVIGKYNWKYNRGLLFLDPYATSVDWSTLEKVAKTKSIDVWYLFPLYALNRMLPRDGHIKQSIEKCIDRILGNNEWKTEFYKPDPQISLFEENIEERVKVANSNKIKEYIISRLKTIFPCVSKNPRIFWNSNNAPIFLFCFAISNPSNKAQGLALRIADYILKHK